MKTETFTPGPWEMFDEGDDHRFWIEGTVKRGNIDYREFVAKTYALPGQREREEANARLIASAPDLLETLKALLRFLPDRNDALNYAATNDGRVGSIHVAVQDAYAAIARAEGDGRYAQSFAESPIARELLGPTEEDN